MSSRFSHVFFLATTLAVSITARANDGDLDPSFGSGGQLLLKVDPFNEPIGATLVAKDVVVQPNGKIVLAGYASASGESEWIVVRLNADGSYDNTFGGGQNGIAYFYVFGPADNQAVSVALRPNGKILVGGTIDDSNNGLVTAVAIQLNSDGSFDTSWGNNGAVYFTPAAGTSTRTTAIVLDTIDPYALGSLYLVGQHTDAAGDNNFFYAGISADGHTSVSNTFRASDNANVSESATSVAVQPGTGNSSSAATRRTPLAKCTAPRSAPSSIRTPRLLRRTCTRVGVPVEQPVSPSIWQRITTTIAER